MHRVLVIKCEIFKLIPIKSSGRFLNYFSNVVVQSAFPQIATSLQCKYVSFCVIYYTKIYLLSATCSGDTPKNPEKKTYEK